MFADIEVYILDKDHREVHLHCPNCEWTTMKIMKYYEDVNFWEQEIQCEDCSAYYDLVTNEKIR